MSQLARATWSNSDQVTEKRRLLEFYTPKLEHTTTALPRAAAAPLRLSSGAQPARIGATAPVKSRPQWPSPAALRRRCAAVGVRTLPRQAGKG
jgi:hypothetical protein